MFNRSRSNGEETYKNRHKKPTLSSFCWFVVHIHKVSLWDFVEKQHDFVFWKLSPYLWAPPCLKTLLLQFPSSIVHLFFAPLACVSFDSLSKDITATNVLAVARSSQWGGGPALPLNHHLANGLSVILSPQTKPRTLRQSISFRVDTLLLKPWNERAAFLESRQSGWKTWSVFVKEMEFVALHL